MCAIMHLLYLLGMLCFHNFVDTMSLRNWSKPEGNMEVEKNCIQNFSRGVLNCEWAKIVRVVAKNTAHLRHLHLRGNNFRTFQQKTIKAVRDDDKFAFLNVIELDIRQCSIRTIGRGAFLSFTGLRAILLDGNLLTRIDRQTIEGITSLRYLSLRYNRLSEVADRALSGLRLNKLLLCGSNLKRLTRATFQSSEVNTLWLNNCQISAVDVNFLQPLVTSLQHLSLSGSLNISSNLQLSSKNLKNLQLHTLQISSNSFETTSFLTKNIQAYSVDVSDSTMDNLVIGSSQIVQLFASHCKIGLIKMTFMPLHLQLLDLSASYVKQVDFSFFQRLPKHFQLNLFKASIFAFVQHGQETALPLTGNDTTEKLMSVNLTKARLPCFHSSRPIANQSGEREFCQLKFFHKFTSKVTESACNMPKVHFGSKPLWHVHRQSICTPPPTFNWQGNGFVSVTLDTDAADNEMVLMVQVAANSSCPNVVCEDCNQVRFNQAMYSHCSSVMQPSADLSLALRSAYPAIIAVTLGACALLIAILIVCWLSACRKLFKYNGDARKRPRRRAHSTDGASPCAPSLFHFAQCRYSNKTFQVASPCRRPRREARQQPKRPLLACSGDSGYASSKGKKPPRHSRSPQNHPAGRSTKQQPLPLLPC